MCRSYQAARDWKMSTPISSGLFLLGGAASAAFAVLKHTSGKKSNEARPSSDMVCPATPSTPYSRSAAGWLRGAGSSSPSKESRASTEAGRSPTITAVSVPQEGIPIRALEAGSLVCFYTSLGELVTIKKESKTWELHACLAPRTPDAEGDFQSLLVACSANWRCAWLMSALQCTCQYVTCLKPAGSCRLPYFPAEAVFVVTRSGSKIGFRSLG